MPVPQGLRCDEAAYGGGEGCAVLLQALWRPGVLGGPIPHGGDVKRGGDHPQHQRQQVGRFQFGGDDPALLPLGDGLDGLPAPLDPYSGRVPTFELAPGVEPQELGTGEEVIEQGARKTGEVGGGERDGVEERTHTLGEDGVEELLLVGAPASPFWANSSKAASNSRALAKPLAATAFTAAPTLPDNASLLPAVVDIDQALVSLGGLGDAVHPPRRKSLTS
jgi:hypothetical protein